jgi:hypothetical protein
MCSLRLWTAVFRINHLPLSSIKSKAGTDPIFVINVRCDGVLLDATVAAERNDETWGTVRGKSHE